MVSVREMRQKLQNLWPHLNERSRRMFAAAEARQLGYGGVSLISRAGGGRRSLVQHDPQLPGLLESLVEPLARGDPESPLRWTCKSTRTLAEELAVRRHPLSHEEVAQLPRQR